MPVIQVDDQRYPLKPGATRLGCGGGVDVSVGTDESLGVQAIIDVAGAAQAVIRRAQPAAEVRVNGVALGVEPTPLLHGDKVEIAGHELLYSDDAKAGATMFVGGADVAALVQKRAAAGRPTTATGGRLISLVDGKEYAIGGGGITIGRDAACGIVVPQTEVSRHHADVLPDEQGYVVHDRSTNGVFVNGERVTGSRLLARADVLRVGTEEFRFYADLARPVAAPAAAKPTAKPAAPAPAAVPVPAPPAPAAASAAAMSAPSAGIGDPLPAPTPMPSPIPSPTPVPMPTPVPAPEPSPRPSPTPSPGPSPEHADARPLLATLEIVNEGPSKGQKFEVHVPLAHVGRGAHNDVVIVDDSVSDTHAKLQRRDDGWYVVDLGSTNGTYVGGHRVTEEHRLDGAPDVRFGGVKVLFRPQGALPDAKGTRMIAGVPRERAQQLREPSSAPRVAPREEPNVPAPSRGLPTWIWIAALVAAAVIAVLVLRG